ncbi:immunoglobulin superfamily member 1-like [Scyliorhinus canicula]|uniref:immunoglobulin superfamily member 1-like n=1 Tax=Scyliorhinus canicula TaxID=7830 RepID=UPI0018F2F1F2|nr:immunoglobulin superfamily member 1-like [Scyliorhinus canicula]
MLAYGRRTYFNFPLPLAANDGDNDYYTCRYSVQSAGRTFTSAESDPLFLVLPERAPEINISLSRPLGSFVLGETVEFSCTTPRHHQGCKYFLYKLGEKTSILSKQAANSTCNATFVMENVTRGAQGNYTCGLQMGQRADINNSSNSVELTLTDSFPKPLLSMEASSLSLFPGENIILSCEAPAEFEVTGFYLRRNDGEDYVAMEQPLASVAAANVTLTDINQSDEGNYTCFYRVVAMGQLRTSQSSDQLQVLLSERLQLRLEQRCLGRVEIYYEKRWGSICGSGWDLRDSTVVCRQLGCGFAEAAVLSGQGSQPALLANVGCHGTEGALWDCLSHTWGARNCSNQEYAAVVCNKDFLPKAALTVLRKSQVFLPGETVNVTCTAPIAFSKMTMYLYQTDGHAREALLSARASEDSATFTVPGVTGTQSGNYTCVYETDIEGDIYTSTQSEALSIMVLDHVQKPIIYGQGPFDTFLRGHGLRIECQAPYELEDLRFYLFKDGGYELSAVASKTASFLFMNISQENEGNFTCLYQVEIAGKVQNTTLSDPLEVTVTDVVSEYVNLRLSSGPSPCSGRLEVFYNGAWGTVCKEGWGIANADVVCRDLNCGFAALSTDAAVYGEGGGPIWLHNVRCLGTESSFWLCASRSHQAHSCTHSDDVGVSCTDSPPPPSIWLNRPSGMFLPGDTIVVQCETHSHYRLAGFYLSSQDGEGPFTFQRSGQAAGIATFTAQAINVIEHSRYSCHYGMATAEARTINSTLSASVLLMVAYVPVNPSLSVDSPLSEFSKGESLTLRCTIPMYRVSTDTIRFQFYQLSQPLVVKGKSPPSPLSSTVFTISSLTPSDGGDYACLYQVERSGRTFNSSYSNSVTVTISDHSNNPTLSLAEPSGVFVLGENVDLTCTSPIRDSETKFCLLKVGRGASPTCLLVGTGHQSITFTLSNVHVTAGGSYACTYEMRKDRKVYKSKASNQVTVSVIEMLPQPSISLSPRWPFFLEGELASIRCIAPEEHAASTCHLGRGQSAQALRSINPGPDGHLCNFLIEKVQLRNQGDYSCHYQAEVSGRMVESRVSVTLHLAVRDSQELQTRLLLSPHEPMDVRDYMDLETRF